MALAHAECRHAGQAPGVRGARTGGLVDEGDLGVEAPGRGDQTGGRARVEPQPVVDPEPHRLPPVVTLLRGGSGRFRRRLDAKLRRLRAEGAAGLGRDLVERRAAARGRRGGDGTLHQWRLAEHHLRRVVGHLERAPQVHQHEHAVLVRGAFDGALDQLGIGADRAGGLGHAAGRLDPHVFAAHLPRELHDALRHAGAVGHDDEADHDQRSR